uniref:ATP synthase F0 subunit 8 n=1 Tax=Paranaspides williamsi TaxID=2231316 RepID=UPI002A7ED303|nr:ATP synthase F0 subunit 8 [Paranaspides williamsi]WOR81138.1 ATP synthase F0 subunit 8 [Paranaspides williamsi]
MPQMAPIFWLLLFLFFTLIFMLFSSVSYFLIPAQKNTLLSAHSSKPLLLWKW